jgi:hypothetical protein
MTGRGYAGRFAAMLLLVFSLGGISLFLAFYIILIQPFPPTYAGVYFALRTLSVFLVPMLVFSMLAYALLVSVAVAILCGFAFHKVAGPLYRMERALENYESGDSVRAVFLREGDQLVALAEAYNDFLTRLREGRREWTAAMEHADRLCLLDETTCRAGRKDALARLSALLSRYR